MTIIHHHVNTSLPGVGSGSADKAQAATGQIAQSQTQAKTQTGILGQSGEVQITPAAQLLANLSQQLSATPDVDQTKVDSIRHALSTGTYRIDTAKVADGILAANKFDAQAAAGSASGAQSTPLKAFAQTAQLGSEKG